MSEEGPRDSPVWFHWERERIWIIGITSTDSFPKRIQKNPKCAIGIVDFDLYRGLVLHMRDLEVMQRLNHLIMS
ncbi:pyridoxamine 5'-phosphate oxidase family protein [Paenibacillus sp. MER TA 81-3]|uniref:pyridoxamine 5'-phosphate oxidase family protein n=1 Tax=Paenibacillus sp. MER TA 81-3 TaxID=2939573 RepID=UPI00203D2482|nr:pyridoxamine 5'-phosphate oxidase family protein [Paenibacillus sp. MER TA 81-3]MCM3337886.1 pyridoxamine 5'-phosphate oxidase family protein [Paenibacillus sp. MER TA 81-3]